MRIKGSTAIAAVFSVLEIMLRHAGPHMLLLLKGVYRVDRWTDELVLRMVAITWLRFRYSSYRSDIAIESTTRAVTRSAKLLKVCSSVACLSPVKTTTTFPSRDCKDAMPTNWPCLYSEIHPCRKYHGREIRGRPSEQTLVTSLLLSRIQHTESIFRFCYCLCSNTAGMPNALTLIP